MIHHICSLCDKPCKKAGGICFRHNPNKKAKDYEYLIRYRATEKGKAKTSETNRKCRINSAEKKWLNKWVPAEFPEHPEPIAAEILAV